ncbi:hypothetical protein FKW77_007017 [Venturia effusa]|uniref:Uncharacterized protein n=1 Tax=Venturia effusa TaxID=50376 RepID=A0A517LE18_9PEZI|nr:hypothetical protein FKW77_007017 [Venturia effusa]
MSRSGGSQKDLRSNVPKILDTASLPNALAWVTGQKRRHSYTSEAAEKRGKQDISENNLENSPLLQLPAELRIRIFEYALTGNTLHIEQLPWGHVDKYEKKDLVFGQGLWNEICHYPDEERDCYSSFLAASMLDATKPFGMSQDGRDIGTGYHVESWSARHSTCSQEPQLFQFNANFERWQSRQQLSLSPLRLCRLIFRECCRLPYLGNTFLFRNPSTFQSFCSSIRPESVQALQKISLPVAVGSAPFSPARSRAWASTIWGYGLAGHFTNLKELRITLELYFPRDIMDNRKPTYLDCKEEVGLSGDGLTDRYTNWLEQLARLRPGPKSRKESSPISNKSTCVPSISLQAQLVRFEVMVCDDPLSMWGPVGQIQYCRDNRIRDISIWLSEREAKCLTVEQKQRLAKEIEERLEGDLKINV